MHVSFDAADLVDENSRRVDAAASEIMMDDGLDLREAGGNSPWCAR